MLDIKFVRENPDVVRENIRKKFQDQKLPLVDEILDLDTRLRAAKTEANDISKALEQCITFKEKKINDLFRTEMKLDELAARKRTVGHKAAES